MLDDDQKERFAADGFVVLRGAIDPARVAAARAAIATSLASDDSVGAMPGYLAATFCPDLVDHPDVHALLEPLRSPIASLLGTSMLPPIKPQIALRFPQMRRTDPRFNLHLDGFPSHGHANQVAAGTIFRHTLLAGIYLTPARGPERGNFVVWPGSHRFYERFLSALDAPAFLAEHGAEALLTRVRAEDPGTPLQLEVEPGDAVLAHHLLAHGASDNLSLHVREAVYFRATHPAHAPHDPASLLDASLFFDGVPWRREQ